MIMETGKNKVIIIAEAGVNHNGDYRRAVEMIYAAKKAGGNDADGAQDDGSLDVKLIHAIAPSLKSRTRTTATKLRTTMQGRAMMCHFFQRALAQPG